MQFFAVRFRTRPCESVILNLLYAVDFSVSGAIRSQRHPGNEENASRNVVCGIREFVYHCAGQIVNITQSVSRCSRHSLPNCCADRTSF